MPIFVKTFLGKTVAVDGNTSVTVDEVMAQTTGAKRLSFKGVELEKGRTLDSYNIQENDVLEEASPIGTLGRPWDEQDKQQWLHSRSKKRSYQQEVVGPIMELCDQFDVVKYGELMYAPESNYQLFALLSKDWDTNKQAVLVTGGVHGYETSGVQGAILFAKEKAARYAQHFNVCILPCVSPWGYEHIERMNPHCQDPSREFFESQEAAQARTFVLAMGCSWLFHVDCHETTDSDALEFMPARAAHAGKEHEFEAIPDGFYCYDREDSPNPDFVRAVVDSVRTVTHIAPADEKGCIMDIQVPKDNPGVLTLDVHSMKVCCAMTPAKFVTTTEVYPDSPGVTAELCNLAQVAAVCGGLDYVIEHVPAHSQRTQKIAAVAERTGNAPSSQSLEK